MDEIKVTVVKFSDRSHLMLRYIDPITGKQRYQSAKTNIRKDASKAAGKWEAELREGRYAAPCRMGWADFRERYEAEALPKLAPRTEEPRLAVMNHVEAILPPRRVSDLTAERLSYFESKLRELALADSTIAGHLAHRSKRKRKSSGLSKRRLNRSASEIGKTSPTLCLGRRLKTDHSRH